MQKTAFEHHGKISQKSRTAIASAYFSKFFQNRPLYPHIMSGISPGTFSTPSAVPHQPVTVEMQPLDGNRKKVNVQLNPQPMVTAETLQTFNKTFLNDLHQLQKSRIIRPVDNVKPKSIGGKILDALKAFGHAVRSLFYSSKNAEAILRTRFNELEKLSTDIKNANIPVKKYKEIQAQTNANIKEIKHFLSSAKEEHKPLLNDCLKFYENFSKELGFDKFQKRSDLKYEPFPTDPKQRSDIQTLANNWKQQIEKLTTLEDSKRIPNKNLSKDDIESLKDAFAELSKAWIPFGKQQSFKNVMLQKEYDKYTELQENIIKAYAKQQAEEMLNFIRGNFESIVEGSMGKDYASSVLDQLKTIKKESSSSASIELLQKLQLLEILLTLQTSSDSNKTFEELLSNDNILLKDEDCIFLVEYFKTLKGNTPNTPLAQKIRNLESNLPKYLREQSEQKVNFETNFLRRKRLSEAAKLYASDRKSNGILNIDIEQTRQNLQIEDLGDENVRNEIIDFLKLKDALDNEDENLLKELSTNKNKDIKTAAKAALERLKQLEQQKKLRSNL